MWSASHGPSLVFEKPLAEEGMEAWRISRINQRDDTPIFLSVKGTQKVFNGYGAQETCDMLFEALLSPCMSTHAVCENEGIWARFKRAVLDYQDTRICIVTTSPSILPYVSGYRPFRFNPNGHSKFLKYVSTYRRRYVKVDREQLKLINDLNLLNRNDELQADGSVYMSKSRPLPGCPLLGTKVGNYATNYLVW